MAALLRSLGAAVVDADEAAHAVYEPGTPGFDAIVAEFGSEYVRDGRIDRERLGELVFRDELARRRLNAIVHPLVREWMAARTSDAIEGGAEIVVHDVPLLFESGLQSTYAAVVLVYAPPEAQLERLVARGVGRERAAAIIASQMPIGEKRRLARFVVDNGGDLEATRRQVYALWAELRSLPAS